jgi:hypothetical protein
MTELRLSDDFYVEIADGNVPGHSLVKKFGTQLATTTLAPITLSREYRMPTTATALEFVSNNVNDTAAGTGAREIMFEGLDANWMMTTQTVATDGTNPVALPTNLTRLFRWWVSKSGTYATTTVSSHAGTLTVQGASAGPIWSIITVTPLPLAQSQIGMISIPMGFRAFLWVENITVDSTGGTIKPANLMLVFREGADVIAAPFNPLRVISNYFGIAGSNSFPAKFPLVPATGQSQGPFIGPADIGYFGEMTSGTGTITVQFEILLIEDGF